MRITKLIIYTCVLTIYTFSGFSQNNVGTSKSVTAVWQTLPELSGASISTAVINNKTGEWFDGTVSQSRLTPASILKVVTTATAIEVLGADYRFKTTISHSGTIRNDTLFGDLQIVGGGDPTLGSTYFPETQNFLNEWAKAVIDNKIKVVKGNLTADVSVYEKAAVPETWTWDDLGFYYGAGASGITAYNNVFSIYMKSPALPGEPCTIEKIVPEIPNLELRNEVISANTDAPAVNVLGNPEDGRRIIRGTLPKGLTNFMITTTIPSPALLVATQLKNKLSENGITIQGEVCLAQKNNNSVTLTETFSPPLRDIAKVTNFESVNLYAEHLLKQLALEKTGLGATNAGCEFVVDFWKEKGLDMNGFFMVDGSGLSRYNAISTKHMVEILRYMKTRAGYQGDFSQLLPTAGNGTLTSFSVNEFPRQSFKAKSGSMTRVRCYAGYITTKSGQDLSFAVMLNNFSCTFEESTRAIQKLLIKLLNQ